MRGFERISVKRKSLVMNEMGEKIEGDPVTVIAVTARHKTVSATEQRRAGSLLPEKIHEFRFTTSKEIAENDYVEWRGERLEIAGVTEGNTIPRKTTLVCHVTP